MSSTNWIPQRRFSRVLAYGTLWAVFVTTSELLVAIPLPDNAGLGVLLVSIAPYFHGWLLQGWIAAAVALYGEPWLDRSWKLGLAIIAVSLCAGAKSTTPWGLRDLLPASWAAIATQSPGATWDKFFYASWVSAFHGGLFIVACVFAIRGERQRQALADARLARSNAETALSIARIDQLTGHVAPAFLLSTMAAVQVRYGKDPDAADDLLDQLVGFLRGAMPGVRGGGSTLRAELAIARSYAAIRASVDGPAAAVAIVAANEGPDIPFPSLLLLPLMDCFTAQQRPSGWQPTLHVHYVPPTHVDIELTGPAGSTVPDDVSFRLHVGLRAVFGDNHSVLADAGNLTAPASLRIRITRLATVDAATGLLSFPPFSHLTGALP